MKSADFPQRNVIVGENQPEYLPLFAHIEKKDKRTPTTFCFELDEAEIAEIVKTKRLWLTQWTFGKRFHPINMSTLTPFAKHDQAFCLCFYRRNDEHLPVEDKGKGIEVYNTVDGSVPVEIKLPDGDYQFRHAKHRPNHRIERGDYFFRAPTPEEIAQRWQDLSPLLLARKEGDETPQAERLNKAMEDLRRQCAEHPVLCRVQILSDDIEVYI